MQSLTLSLPYPLSVNALWRSSRRGGWYRSKAYREWRKTAGWDIRMQLGALAKDALFPETSIGLKIDVGRPDLRRRDIDNLAKCICDLLQDFNVIQDDSLIEEITIRRFPDIAGCHVTVWAMTPIQNMEAA